MYYLNNALIDPQDQDADLNVNDLSDSCLYRSLY